MINRETDKNRESARQHIKSGDSRSNREGWNLIFRKIHTIWGDQAELEQNFEQNERFLRALPAGRISHFTSRIYPSLPGVQANWCTSVCAREALVWLIMNRQASEEAEDQNGH